MGNRNKDIEKLFEQKDLLECKIKMIKQIIADLENHTIVHTWRL